MKPYFQTLANYNTWANQRLYDACQQLTPEAYFLDRKAFFTSIHGTLNHLLVGDIIWLSRWQNKDSDIKSLDKILYPDFDSLKQARQVEDKKLLAFINNFDEAKLNDLHHFHNLAGEAKTQKWLYMFGHLFNHQTHHRGQVHNMLSQAGLETPALDLHYFISMHPPR